MNRREFIRRFVVSSALFAVSASAIYEIVARASAGQQQTIPSLQQTLQTSQTGSGSAAQIQAPAGYVFVAALTELTGKTSAYFQHPAYGPSLLIDAGGQWKAFSSTCTHVPCTVQYAGSSIYCPCHGGTFSPVDGGVLSGPPPRALPEYGVLVQRGNLYVSDSVVN